MEYWITLYRTIWYRSFISVACSAFGTGCVNAQANVREKNTKAENTPRFSKKMCFFAIFSTCQSPKSGCSSAFPIGPNICQNPGVFSRAPAWPKGSVNCRPLTKGGGRLAMPLVSGLAGHQLIYIITCQRRLRVTEDRYLRLQRSHYKFIRDVILFLLEIPQAISPYGRRLG